MVMQARYLSCAETAKLVRAALAKNFPGVKFSVRSNTYAGGASIDVQWTLGPTVKEVDNIAGQYESASFDGMIDMETHYSHWLMPDGSARIESGPGTEGSRGVIPAIEPQPRPEGAELVSFGAHYVQCARKLTENYEDEMKFRAQVAQDMCILQKVAYTGPYTVHLFGEGDTEQADQHAWRLINQTSFKPGEEYAGVRYSTEEERNSEGWDPWAVFVIVKKGPPVPAASTPEPAGTAPKTGIVVRDNEVHKGIDLEFPAKPPALVINNLKANGWRWSHTGGFWYNKQTPENKKFALGLQSGSH
jgi:hypothetical protein